MFWLTKYWLEVKSNSAAKPTETYEILHGLSAYTQPRGFSLADYWSNCREGEYEKEFNSHKGLPGNRLKKVQNYLSIVAPPKNRKLF